MKQGSLTCQTPAPASFVLSVLHLHLKHDKDVKSMRMPKARCHSRVHQIRQKAQLYYLSHEAILCFPEVCILRVIDHSDSRIRTQKSLPVQDRVINRKKKL